MDAQENVGTVVKALRLKDFFLFQRFHAGLTKIIVGTHAASVTNPTNGCFFAAVANDTLVYWCRLLLLKSTRSVDAEKEMRAVMKRSGAKRISSGLFEGFLTRFAQIIVITNTALVTNSTNRASQAVATLDTHMDSFVHFASRSSQPRERLALLGKWRLRNERTLLQGRRFVSCSSQRQLLGGLLGKWSL